MPSSRKVRSFLHTWNPTRRGSWKRFRADLARFERKGALDLTWSCGSRRDLPVGSRVFLMRLGGAEPSLKGLIGRGLSTGSPFRGEHWSAERRGQTALYVQLRLDDLSETPRLSLVRLQQLSPSFGWTPQASGVEIPPDIADVLESEWNVAASASRIPEELSAEEALIEGAARTVRVNAWERSHEARRVCLRHHGTRCAGCGVDLEAVYGSIAKGFVHVHHVVPLARIGKAYVVDPVKDLVPVCPTCHAVIHLASPPLTVEAIRERLEEQRRTRAHGSRRVQA